MAKVDNYSGRNYSRDNQFTFKKKKVEAKKESQFQNDEQRKDFNIWLNETFITGRGVTSKNEKFITIKGYNNKHEVESNYNLVLGTKKFDDWLDERIKEFKELNLLK
jgi:hypothetical protein